MVATKEEAIAKPIKTAKDVEEVIAKAIKKLGARKENELCKYLPMKTGGYMHHFTLKKMKTKQPQELAGIIERFVINADRPIVIAPKQRAARGSRKRKDHLNFTRIQLERMLNIARLAGDKEIITILSPRKSLASCKRELIQSIRNHKVEPELWANYSEAVHAQQLMQETLANHQH
ncbi:MAG: hypothetical protein KGR16_06045 [Verrucomicrobia bacterium]|nr:hypothetical protein [Verrucomicrobiota bacterium]MDE3047566.1 hypothetical protein [Verrucomicrobiota bacterium]